MNDAPIGDAPAPVSWRSLLRTVRVPFLALLLAAAGLLVPPQTTDMLAALADGSLGGVDFTAIFHGTLALLSVSAWFWARALISARFDVGDTVASRDLLIARDRRVDRRALDLVPRLMFVLSVLFGVGLLLRSGQWRALPDLAIWSVPLLLLIQFRLPLAERLRRVLGNGHQAAADNGPGRPAGSDVARWLGELRPRLELLLRRAPFSSPWLTSALVIVPLAIFVAGAVESFATWGPAHAGLAALTAVIFPGPCAALIAIALMIGPLATVGFLIDGLRIRVVVAGARIGPSRPPLVVPLLAWILLAPMLFSLHTVRIAPYPERGWPVAERRDLADFFRVWVRDCAPSTGPVRPVVVAISGGATRAAIWGARVLRELERASGPGGPSVFAVSSVSGGSLAAAAYMGLLARLDAPQRCAAGSTPKRAERLEFLAALERMQDALGPLLAGALLVDVPRAIFSPVAALAHLATGRSPRGGDRAEALERAFERLWRVARPAGSTEDGPPRADFGDPFLSLFYDINGIRPGMPVWIANGTDVGTGNRLLTAPFSPAGAWPFRAAADTLAALGADVAISTAINNSARFPYLEPAGELRRSRQSAPPPGTAPADDGRSAAAEIVDGGYFDNEGLETALELADWLRTAGPGLIADRRAVEPIIVEATGEGVTIDHIVRCGSPPDDPAIVPGTARPPQLLAPVLGILDVRGSHSAVLLREARDRYCAPRKAFFHFYLPGEDLGDVPLNWILSDAAAHFVWTAMDASGSGNAAESASLSDTFRTP